MSSMIARSSGAMGPGLLMSAIAKQIPEAKRNVANGIVNAGGSFGQFTVIPLAGLFIVVSIVLTLLANLLFNRR